LSIGLFSKNRHGDKNLGLFPSLGERGDTYSLGSLRRTNLNHWTTLDSIQFKFRLLSDRKSVVQSIMVSRDFYCHRTFEVFRLGAPSLTRGRVCNLLVQFAVTLRSKSPYLYPPGTWWPSYTPWHWVPLSLLLTTRRATVELFYPASIRGFEETQLLLPVTLTLARTAQKTSDCSTVRPQDHMASYRRRWYFS
jgi:hypothetical protein